MAKISVETVADVIAARQAAREAARRAGLGGADQTRLATAVSELTRNAIQYAGRGTCAITDRSDQQCTRIQVVVEDDGPGIDDIELVLNPPSGNNRQLGAGLPGTRRLMTEFTIESSPGHTKVSIALVRRL